MNVDLARFNMVEQQVRPWDILDQRVLDVLERIPRENFVPHAHRNLAFADLEIPLGHGETMLAPKIEGRILQALTLQPTDVVLEIGTGSGHLTACLAQLAAQVHSVDIHADFTQATQAQLTEIGIDNVTLHTGDASAGWPQPGRYDVIVVGGSLPEYRDDFERQLNPGGRLFVVVGEAPVMEAMLVTRTSEDAYARIALFETCLPPLAGVEPKPKFMF